MLVLALCWPEQPTLLSSGAAPCKCISATPEDTRGREEGQLPSFEFTTLIKLCRTCASNRAQALYVGLTQTDFSKAGVWTLQMRAEKGKG